MANEVKAEAKANEPKTHKQLVKETAAAAVKAQIGGNREHGWGLADSSAVIDQIVAEHHEAVAKNKGLTAEMLAAIEEVINPSAFRLKLESDSVNMLNKGESRKAKRESFLSSMAD